MKPDSDRLSALISSYDKERGFRKARGSGSGYPPRCGGKREAEDQMISAGRDLGNAMRPSRVITKWEFAKEHEVGEGGVHGA